MDEITTATGKQTRGWFGSVIPARQELLESVPALRGFTYAAMGHGDNATVKLFPLRRRPAMTSTPTATDKK